MSRTVQPDDLPHVKAAFADLGLSEIAGPRHSKRVLAMYAAAGHPEVKDDETAWCAAAVGCWLKESGSPNSGSLMARSYLKYGMACDLKKRVPRGAIIVWPRGAPPSAHVNIAIEDDGTFLTCIGGNQSNGAGGGVTISRERKSRALSARLPKAKAVPLPKPKPVVTPDVEDTAEPAPVEPSKPLVQSKIAQGAGTIIAADGVDLATKAGEAVEQAKAAKENVEDLGLWDVAVHFFSNPRVLVGLVVLVVAAGIIYWRWRDHQ